MTDIRVDESRIGPLISSRIPKEPISWGGDRAFTVTDRHAQVYVEREISRERSQARKVLQEEIRVLLTALRDGTNPVTPLHGLLTWGPLSVTRLAGYIGRPLGEVSQRIGAFEVLGLVVPEGVDEYGDSVYTVNPEADVFKDE